MTPIAPDASPLYITGIHRSGTSWVGNILAGGGEFRVKDEEIFNCEDNMTATPIRQMYLHVCRENETAYLDYVQGVLDDRYSVMRSLRRIRTVRDIARVVKRKARALGRAVSPRRRLILIEPIGLLSTEWFAQRFGARVVILVRHPASFASSLRRNDWGFDFRHLLDQPLLMRDQFARFEKELREAPPRTDVIGQAILLWKIMYSVVSRFQQQHPDWLVCRHEDLAANPQQRFRGLYGSLGLSFDDTSSRVVDDYSSERHPVERCVGVRDDSRRNSAGTVDIWRRRLSRAEVARIREGVGGVADLWYGERDWA